MNEMAKGGYDVRNPPRLHDKVLFRGEVVECISAPSYALGTIRVMRRFGEMTVRLDELERVTDGDEE